MEITNCTPESITAFIEKVGFKSIVTKAEVKSLHTVLLQNEIPVYILQGLLQQMNDKNAVGVGVLLLTNKRALFYRKSMLGTVTREEYPIDRISSVSLRKGILLSSIHIYTGNIESIIKDCDSSRAKKMVDELQSLMHKEKEHVPTQIIQQTAPDLSAELEKWHGLKEKGIITPAEFEEKKRVLLNT